jgi:hypothetical protein
MKITSILQLFLIEKPSKKCKNMLNFNKISYITIFYHILELSRRAILTLFNISFNII